MPLGDIGQCLGMSVVVPHEWEGGRGTAGSGACAATGPAGHRTVPKAESHPAQGVLVPRWELLVENDLLLICLTIF